MKRNFSSKFMHEFASRHYIPIGHIGYIQDLVEALGGPRVVASLGNMDLRSRSEVMAVEKLHVLKMLTTTEHPEGFSAAQQEEFEPFFTSTGRDKYILTTAGITMIREIAHAEEHGEGFPSV